MKHASWILTIMVALMFFAAGGTKLLGMENHVENFASWNLPLIMMYVTGGLELAGATLLLAGRYLSNRFILTFGSALINTVMGGAVVVHFYNGESVFLPIFMWLTLTVNLLVGWPND